MKRKAGPSEREGYWLAHLEACERGGQSTKAYAHEHGLSVSMMYSWRKKLTARGLWARESGPRSGATFDRFEVVDAGMPVAWHIVLPNGVEIGFCGAVDASALAAVLGAAKGL